VVSVDENEDVVDADGKNKKRNHFDDDQSGGNPQVAEEPDACANRQQDYDDTTETKRHLGINLQRQQVYTCVPSTVPATYKQIYQLKMGFNPANFKMQIKIIL